MGPGNLGKGTFIPQNLTNLGETRFRIHVEYFIYNDYGLIVVS